MKFECLLNELKKVYPRMNAYDYSGYGNSGFIPYKNGIFELNSIKGKIEIMFQLAEENWNPNYISFTYDTKNYSTSFNNGSKLPLDILKGVIRKGNKICKDIKIILTPSSVKFIKEI